jgi:hypothetical protein
VCAQQLEESDIIDHLEKMCDPDSADGAWILKQDMVETGDTIEVVDVGQVRSSSIPSSSSGGSSSSAPATSAPLQLGDHLDFLAAWRVQHRVQDNRTGL